MCCYHVAMWSAITVNKLKKNEEIVNMGVDYYDILKLTRSATDADIKKK